MPPGSPRNPRASRLMIEIFHAIHACEDLVDYWDVGRRADGVVVRVRSRIRHEVEQVANEVVTAIGTRVRPLGHEVVQVSTSAGADGAGSSEKNAFLEVVIA